MRLNSKKIKNLLFLLFIFYQVSCQQKPPDSSTKDVTQTVEEDCKNVRFPKRFTQCNQKSNLDNMQICCYLTGVNADKTPYDGCIAVNSTLFANKTIEFESSGLSGRLICTENYSFMNYIYISIFNIFIFILLF